MTNQNPYLSESGAQLPQQPYHITFVAADGTERVVTVDPQHLADGGHGQTGSILQIALANDIEIDHACGGVCACSTCHVIVRAGLDACNPPADEEEDMLDSAYGVVPQSRLACQTIPDGTQDLRVEVPSWNRNLIREGH